MIKLRKRFCPHCKHTLDAASNMKDENAKPRKGDFTVCINCAEILEFDKNLRPAKLKGLSLEGLGQSQFDELMAIRNAVVRMKND